MRRLHWTQRDKRQIDAAAKRQGLRVVCHGELAGRYALRSPGALRPLKVGRYDEIGAFLKRKV